MANEKLIVRRLVFLHIFYVDMIQGRNMDKYLSHEAWIISY